MNILLNVSFCVPQKTKNIGQHEGELMLTDYLVSLKKYIPSFLNWIFVIILIPNCNFISLMINPLAAFWPSRDIKKFYQRIIWYCQFRSTLSLKSMTFIHLRGDTLSQRYPVNEFSSANALKNISGEPQHVCMYSLHVWWHACDVYIDEPSGHRTRNNVPLCPSPWWRPWSTVSHSYELL